MLGGTLREAELKSTIDSDEQQIQDHSMVWPAYQQSLFASFKWCFLWKVLVVVPVILASTASLTWAQPQNPVEKSHFIDFLIFDDNPAAMVELSGTRPEAFLYLAESDLNSGFDFLFMKFHRENTRTWVKNLYQGWGCSLSRKDPAKQKLCAQLQYLWQNPLLETYFWDISAVHISRARELINGPHSSTKIKTEQCQEALKLCSQVQNKEGLMGPLAETQLKVFECLGDEEGRNEVYRNLETLRDINSAIGT